MGNASSTESVLPATGWLGTLTEEERRVFGSFGEVLQMESKQILIREDEPQPNFFFIIEGMLSVRRGDAVMAVVCSGEFLGEMSIATKRPASATVVTLEPSKIWKMGHEELLKFIYAHHEIGIKILFALLSTVSDRLYAVNADLAELLSGRRR